MNINNILLDSLIRRSIEKRMVFSSITFLFYFLPIVLGLYYLAPEKVKNLVLFLSSLVFYAWGEPKYVILMLVTIMVGYTAGMLMDKLPKKLVMIVSVGACLCALIYFKYADFFVSNINVALKTEIPLLKVALPIGISFYTFQIISYIVDVYRGTVEKQTSFLKLATYVSMFPQLIAGPIVRYSDINGQLSVRTIASSKIADGMRRFAIGLGKKVLIANQLGELCQVFRVSDEKTLAFYWLYAVAISLQIYFDFSGYSDMAIGLGKLLGFEFSENFNYPFVSKSVTEFWRRWHISLGSWFRDYVYIPLGGNRKGLAKQMVNILLVWMLTGFWHGAQWNFVLWGLFFAVLLVIEKMWLYNLLQTSRIWSRIYMFLVVTISFVIFSAGNMSELCTDVGSLFFIGEVAHKMIVGTECAYYLRSYGGILLLAIIGATHVPKMCYETLRNKIGNTYVVAILEALFVVAMLFLSTAYLIDGSFNPFLYFRF